MGYLKLAGQIADSVISIALYVLIAILIIQHKYIESIAVSVFTIAVKK